MAYADTTATFVKWVKVWEEELKNAVSATENSQTNLAALTADIDSLSEAGKATVAQVSAARRALQSSIPSQAREQVLPILAQIARDIDSQAVSGDSITDLQQFFRDWRNYQDNTIDEKVTARSVTFASEPAASAAGNAYRLTVGVLGTGDKIESGRHATTQRIRCTSKPAPYRATFSFEGTEGALDPLNYTAAPAGGATITQVNENDSGPIASVTNPNMTGNADLTDNAAVTVMTGWTLTNTSGSPTLLIEKTSAKLWRGRSNVFSISGTSTTKTISQSIPTGVLTDRYQPFLPVFPVYLNSGWQGTVTITWGSKSQAFTESDMTAGDWKNLAVDRDLDLYPYNFDQSVPTWAVAIATGAGASTNELVFAGLWAPAGTKYNDLWYWIFADDDEPTLQSSVFSFADTQTAAGEIQDTLDIAFQDEGIGAYLMTANSGGSGATTLADPS